jgi:hypothetical protein
VNATTESTGTGRRIELGLRQNAAQFTLLVVVNALVGGMLVRSGPCSRFWGRRSSASPPTPPG